MRLEGKVAIITGGAGGIGQALTRRFVQEGAKVAVADPLDEAGRAIEAEVNAEGKRAFFQHTDVTVAQHVEAVVARTIEEFGPPTVLVNCAGWHRFGAAIHAVEEDFDRALAVHVKGTWLMAKHVIPHMMRSGGGAIVNVSSMQAVVAIPGRVAYEAAKGGISAMTRLLALEYGPAKVRVNAVCPGVIMTPRSLRRHQHDFAAADVQARIESYPLRRLGTPEDVAGAVAFLASDDASWITGVNLLVDGGITIQATEAVTFGPLRQLWREAVPQA